MLGVLVALVFIGVAAYLLSHSYHLLKEILPDPSTEAARPSPGVLRLLGSIIGLLIWFSTGIVAFTTGVGSLAEKLILALQ